MHDDDAFDRWNLSEKSSVIEIKKKYRSLVQKTHPDRVGMSEKSQNDFCQLRSDYEILINPITRNILIEKRELNRQKFHTSSFFSSESPVDNFSSSNTSSFFVPPSNITIYVPLSLNEVWLGGTCIIRFLKSKPCSCNRLQSCPICKGTGQNFFTKNLRVTYPQGVLPQQEIIILGEGHIGSELIGDMRIIIVWKKTHGWRWNGQSLVTTVIVNSSRCKVGKYIWIYSPSGTLGRFTCPDIKSSSAWIQLPILGFLTEDNMRQSVFVCVKKSAWYIGWWFNLIQKQRATQAFFINYFAHFRKLN